MFLNLYSSCQLTKGYTNCSILDTQRNDVYLIDYELYYLLLDGYIDLEKTAINKAKLAYYKSFLLSNELAFLSSEKISIGKTNYEWDYPAYISNAIIEYNLLSNPLGHKIVDQLSNLLCSHIELRILNKVSINDLITLNNMISNSDIRSLDIFIDSDNFPPFDQKFTEDLFFSSIYKTNRLVLFNHESESYTIKGENKVIIKTINKLNNNICGLILPEFFAKNIYTFSESQNFNTCLNRKIAIDINGNIRNCLSLPENYGNIQNLDLEHTIKSSSFKKYWTIKKDIIKVCRDCEFRHFCTDCRAFLEDPDDLLSKPLKCGYDPYKGIWEEWSDNPLKNKAIKYYNL